MLGRLVPQKFVVFSPLIGGEAVTPGSNREGFGRGGQLRDRGTEALDALLVVDAHRLGILGGRGGGEEFALGIFELRGREGEREGLRKGLSMARVSR
jgi:hypothetical protein